MAMTTESLVTRTARAIYGQAIAEKSKSLAYDLLTAQERDLYERMARAALTEGLREPVAV